VKPKDALKKAGFPVKEGRGRLPKDAIEKCKQLVAEGWVIDGYAVEKPTKSTKSTAPVVNKAPVQQTGKVIDEFVIFWPLEEWTAKGKDGRIWSMKEVCNTCRVSLVQNHCDSPTILGGIPVDIVRRK